VEISPAQGVAGEAAPRSYPVGQQLRAAREARNMSLAEAAQSLKLGSAAGGSPRSRGLGSVLPGNTMIRGFVRNYARLLNIDSDLLMRGLDAAQLQQTLQLEISAGTSASLPQAGRRVERRDYLAVLAGLLLLSLAVLAYFYVPADFWQEKMAACSAAARLAGASRGAGTTATVVAAPKAAAVGNR
jgi:cytoskeleton protein RodZ